MNIQSLVKAFGKWPSFILLFLATVMPLLVALVTTLR